MTNNPIDMAIYAMLLNIGSLKEYSSEFCHGIEGDVEFFEKAMQALKTYRDEYISIKKSDVPEHPISNSVQDWNRYTNKCVYLITQALEADDE